MSYTTIMKKLLFIALLACVSPILIAQQKPNIDEIRTKCDLGDGMSCNNLGVLYEEGQGVQQSYQEAVRLHQKGCDLGNGVSCTNLGGRLPAR